MAGGRRSVASERGSFLQTIVSQLTDFKGAVSHKAPPTSHVNSLLIKMLEASHNVIVTIAQY